MAFLCSQSPFASVRLLCKFDVSNFIAIRGLYGDSLVCFYVQF